MSQRNVTTPFTIVFQYNTKNVLVEKPLVILPTKKARKRFENFSSQGLWFNLAKLSKEYPSKKEFKLPYRLDSFVLIMMLNKAP